MMNIVKFRLTEGIGILYIDVNEREHCT
jgi:hypothetical protein